VLLDEALQSGWVAAVRLAGQLHLATGDQGHQQVEHGHVEAERGEAERPGRLPRPGEPAEPQRV
jgi:hypothetical protein